LTLKVPHDTPRGARRWLYLGLAVVAGVVALSVWRLRSAPVANPDLVWRQAEIDFLAERYGQAEAGLKRLAGLRSPTPLDLVLEAQVAMLRNRPAEVLADLDAVPDGHPMAPQARLLAGQFELRRLRPKAAEHYLEEAVRLDPTLVQPHKELIYIYGMLLRRPELNAEFRTLGALTPLTFDNIFHWCLTRNSVWDPKEITEELRSYLAADHDDKWSRLALAENLRQISQRKEAETLLEALPKSDPDAIVVRARLALDRNDDQTLEAVLEAGPEDHAELARLRGRLALARQDGPAALKAFRAAYKAEPDHRDALAGLGQALTMTGDPKSAAPFIAAARDHDQFATLMQRAATPTGRNDPELWRALGAACEKIHRIPEARAWYGLVIQADPLDADAQKALFRLKSQTAPPPLPLPGERGKRRLTTSRCPIPPKPLHCSAARSTSPPGTGRDARCPTASSPSLSPFPTAPRSPS
jgi:tetratricopeptide (TPR) repeat protein